MLINKSNSEVINHRILDWFYKNRRSFPFRETKEPYHVWISEIMAQQTQMKTVVPYFERFIQAFPTVNDLAQASLEDVYSLWEGLGYYNRAKNLKRASKIIVKEGFPDNYKALQDLPGIGSYTAGAIASICFNERVPAIDGNVIRVISRIYGINIDLSVQKNKKELFDDLLQTMPEQSGDYNESLMELGALICTPRNPNCLICPVRLDCFAYNNNQIENLPLKTKKATKKIIHNESLIILRDGKPLFFKRSKEGILAEQYGFPIIEKRDKKGESVQNLVKQFETHSPRYLGHSTHTFTHLKWETDVYVATENKVLPTFTISPSSVPTAFKKMVQLL